MIDRDHDLSIVRQAKVLKLARSTHHLHSDAAWLRLSRGGRRCVQPTGPGPSRLDHNGGGLLRRSGPGGVGEARQARDFQHGSGQPFTSLEFTDVLLDAKIAISMDGKGAWRDNVFVERLWRTVKYEEVYLRAYDSVSEARASIAKYLAFYNQGRPHSSLDGRTPDEAYFGTQAMVMAA